jgi:hypothetical protein
MNKEEIVFEFLSDYFEDELNEEKINNDDIIDAVCILNELCIAVNDYFEINEVLAPSKSKTEPIPDFASGEFSHKFNAALKDHDDWPPRPATNYIAAVRKWKTSKEGKRPTHLRHVRSR